MQQMSIFDDVLERYKITKPIRLIEFFSGIGSQAKALEVLGANFEHYKTCEWAYNSYCAYNSIHIKDKTDYSKDLSKEELVKLVSGTSVNYNEPLTETQLNKKPIEWLKNAYNNIKATHNLVNIMNVKGKDLEIVDSDKYTYILTYSFPCQDLSLAGKRAGMSVSQADGGTRSGLLWEVERILQECKDINQLPQILVMENVPEVCGSKNVRDFEKWQMRLNQLGYTNYCEILNAKDYGIPQNRRRCFMVSILGDYNYTFPKKIQLKYRLKDLLEKDVDEKYFLSQKFLNYVTHNSSEKYNRAERFEESLKQTNENGVAVSLTTRQGRGALDNYINESKQVGYIEKGTGKHQSNTVYDGENISPTLSASDYKEPVKIAIKNNNSKGYELAESGDGIDISTRMHHHRGTVQHGSSQTLTCEGGNNVGVVVGYSKNSIKHIENNLVKDDIASTLVTNSNFTGNGVNLIKEPYMKQELCDKLVEEGKVQEGDIVNHSYSNSRLNGRKAVERQNEMPALTTRPDTMGVAVKDDNFTELEKELITENGNVRRYIGSDKVDEFKEGQMASLTYPNGYGRGPRTHDESIALNTIDKPVVKNNLRIRKLTPAECMKLMSFTKKDTDAMREIGLSDAAIYHCAGDSIVSTVLVAIFSNLLNELNSHEKIINDYVEKEIL